MEETNWKINGYTSAAIALRSAESRGEAGLKGSGQECGPVCMDGAVNCCGWVYCTWDKRYLIPHGELSHKAMCKKWDLQNGNDELKSRGTIFGHIKDYDRKGKFLVVELDEIVVNDKHEIRIVSWDNVESVYDEDYNKEVSI